MDLDELLPKVGEFGRYQRLVIFLVCLPACWPCGFNGFNHLFMTQTPDHWCKVPELSNYSKSQVLNVAIPSIGNYSHASCFKYAVNWSAIIEDSGGSIENVVVNQSWPVETCRDGWIYNTSIISSSIVIDYDLVCDKALYTTYALSAFNGGGLIGVYFFGYLTDRIGRKKTYFFTLFVLLLGGILTACSMNFEWFLISRIITGLNVPSVYQVAFVLALEIVGPKYRSFVTVLISFFYAFGMVMLGCLSYFIHDWRTLAWATSAPFTLFFLYWFVLPESPRWLLVRGRFEEASTILQRLAKVNGKELPTSFKQELKQKMLHTMTSSEEAMMKRHHGFLSLCKTPNMRLKTCLITLSWFVNQSVYVGLSYYGPALGDNQYLSFILSFIVELPTISVTWLVIDIWGRRWPLCLSMLLSGCCCIGTALVPLDVTWITLVLYLMAKSTISAAFLIIYPYTGELYPTQLRGVGLGTSCYVAGLGLLLIPFVNYLGTDLTSLPLVIMGTMTIIGAVAGLRLPETLHYPLPQTLEDGEEFGKDFGMKDCCRCIPLRPHVSVSGSYEDLELEKIKSEDTEETPLENTKKKRMSVGNLVRQASVLDAPKDIDGTMKITYYF